MGSLFIDDLAFLFICLFFKSLVRHTVLVDFNCFLRLCRTTTSDLNPLPVDLLSIKPSNLLLVISSCTFVGFNLLFFLKLFFPHAAAQTSPTPLRYTSSPHTPPFSSSLANVAFCHLMVLMLVHPADLLVLSPVEAQSRHWR